MAKLRLRLHEGAVAVVRLPPDADVPTWALHGTVCSVTRTPDELSVICAWRTVPADLARVGPWIAFAVDGPLDFGLVGVMASLAGVLAAAGIPMLAISTHDTDWILVRSERADDARTAFETAGIPVTVAGQGASDVT